MARSSRVFGWTVALVGVLGLSLGLLARVGAQTDQRCFSETGFCVGGPFRVLWEQGGLSIFGLPLGPQGLPQGISGPAEVQWFERQRFELHPANPAPYSLLLGRLGAERLAQLGRDWQTAPPSPPQTGCRYFAETGRNLCPPFLAAWSQRGLPLDGQAAVSYAESLALFGLPLTEAVEEEVEGRRFLVQWFERARFELHVGEGGAQLVLLGRLGAELLAAGGGGVGGTLPADAPAALTATAEAGAATAAAPTPTRPAPTATRPPRRPTSEPDVTEVPEETTVLEPSSTSIAQPTNTRVPPTSTPVPPTPVPPTPTPTDPFTSPGAPPPGFAGSRTLPSASAGGNNLEDYNLSTRSIGSVICYNVESFDPDPLFSGAQDFAIAGPDGYARTLSVELDGDTTTVTGRWVPGIDLTTGIYSITTTLPNTTTATGTFDLVSPAAGSGRNITLDRVTDSLTESDINSCSDTIIGDPGDEFGAILTGFEANEVVELYLYGRQQGATGSPVFLGLLETVTTDGNGQAYVSIPTEASYPSGAYLILTREQADANFDETGSFQGEWPQRFTLRAP